MLLSSTPETGRGGISETTIPNMAITTAASTSIVTITFASWISHRHSLYHQDHRPLVAWFGTCRNCASIQFTALGEWLLIGGRSRVATGASWPAAAYGH